MHTPPNPIVAELWRGEGVESFHRGAWVVVDTGGALLAGCGDADQLVYGRSSTKSMQVLPLIESGAATTLGVSDDEIAISISSHNGEAIHVAAARSLLARAGLSEEHLLCGATQATSADPGSPVMRITNNCSGKHAGFLAAAVTLGDDPTRYLHPDSALQVRVRQTVLEMTGAHPSRVSTALDGCSAPTFRLPLRALATGLARMANPDDLEPGRADACRRIVSAAAQHPELVAGTAIPRFDTDLLRATSGRLFAKGGAEAVQTVGIVGAGLGFAAKIDDGSSRSLARLTIAVLTRLGHLATDELDELKSWHDPARRNAAGLEIGRHAIREDVLPQGH